MKIAFLIFSIHAFTSFAQIKELREAQDTRKTHFDINKESKYFSKSTFVNPFIGTGGHGHTYPGASAPFGMIQLSPDTRHDGWDGCSGYHYSDSVIYGFSHTHLSGTGVPDYGDLLICPQSGKPKVEPAYLNPKGYGSRFSHKNEHAAPGSYKVHLEDENIDVELIAGQRSGLHSYTFNNPKGEKFILLDLDYRDQLLSADFKIISNNELAGKRISKAWANEQHFYFFMESNIPWTKARVLNKNGQHKLLLIFPRNTTEILLRVGISSVDTEGAEKNLRAELFDWDKNRIRAVTTALWNKELDRIHFEHPDKNTMTIFYTALYHSLLNPNLFTDSDRRYRGMDQQIHQLNPDEGDHYTVFSLWDTYRATHPLFTLIQEKRTVDFIETFLRQHNQGGELPVWELAANETDCMIGYHSVSVIADAFSKGLTSSLSNNLLKAMLHTASKDELGKKQFRENGFIQASDEPESVSKTLEYAYDDFCIANFAKQLGDSIVANNYFKSSLNFLNLYDPSTKFMRAKRGALWLNPFDPAEVNVNYTEANSWQYSLYAPHATDIMSVVMGGKDSLEAWLDRLFSSESNLSGRHQVDITGLIGQYAHGNEPSHHMAYLYNYTNSPFKTQYYVDKIFREQYRNAPDGLAGNEDCGQMSSWYVLSALGLYQVAPGHPYYDFGRPLTSKAILDLGNGKKLIINTKNNNEENLYIREIYFNGELWTHSGISHHELMKGGELIFVMGSKPVNKLSPSVSAMTFNQLKDFEFTPTPFVTNDTRIFDDFIDVAVSVLPLYPSSQLSIEYRLDKSSPVSIYKSPIKLTESSQLELRTRFNRPDGMTNYSAWVKTAFIKRDQGVSLQLNSAYSPQYAASGANTLIDGERGGKEYRTGEWQGFWDTDVEATVVFDEKRKLKRIGVSCLRDHKSWIFFPGKIIIETSVDGKTFNAAGTITIQAAKTSDATPENQLFYKLLSEAEQKEPIKAIRFKIINSGPCPTWHLGNGNPTWLFIDELIYD